MKKNVKILLTIGLLLLMVGIGVGYVWMGTRPLPQGKRDIPIAIQHGAGTAAIAAKLEEQGIIRSAFLFKMYLKWVGEGSRFQAGKYAFRPGKTYADIIAKLNKGEVIPQETVVFTIPEGYTVEQIADKLSKDKLVVKQRFLQLANDTTWLQSAAPIVAHIPNDDKLKYRLEGFLFPETYKLKKGSTEEHIITRMVQETEKRLAQASATLESERKARGLTLHELMTFASLVEQEAVIDGERPLIAGVIYNRLARGMRLQIDATVQYALGKPRKRLYHQDLKIESSYNTYKIDKLPPGPIASPSTASIQAVLRPMSSDYLYYVTKKDGTKMHLFAKTFAEHQRNVQQSNKMMKERGAKRT